MPTVSRVTPALFNAIKAELEHIDPTTAAMKNHLSVKTILQIKGSLNFHEYEQSKRAQHPAPKNPPMPEQLAQINQKLDMLIAESKTNKLL